MKKLLFVVPSLNVGGTLSSLKCIIEYLDSEYEINVLALSHDGSPSGIRDNILLRKSILLHGYYCNYNESIGFDKYIIALIKIIKRFFYILKIDLEKIISRAFASNYQSYDIIVAFQEGCVTKFVSHIQHQRKIAWIHCDYKNYCSTPKELHIYEKFSTIVCVSKYTANTFSTIYPSLQDRVQSVNNLLNLNAIESLAKSSVYDNLFVKDYFTIISVGRIDPVKRFEYIPSIAYDIKSRGCKFRWYIIGPELGNECFNKLCAEIKYYNVEREVVYLGSKSNPYPYFSNADLLVSLSYTEACPMIFNEAKILDLPVLTTDFGSSYEFIQNGDSGIIVPFQDIADTLYSILSNPQCYNSLKQNVTQQEYSNENILLQLRSIFSDNNTVNHNTL